MSLSNKSKSRVKGVVNLILVVLGLGFLVALFFFKGSMNNLVSKKMAEQAGAGVKRVISQAIDSAYNYEKNGNSFTMTFLEFGATGCLPCKKMEAVMDRVKVRHANTVYVKFISVILPENQDLVKYYGVASIPAQILLDRTGKEYFRHYGYLSFEELEKHLKIEL
jgi:thioredoxin 1